MHKLLPQQRLLLELLAMSGDIAVSDGIDGTILHHTLVECEAARLVTQAPYGAGFSKLSVTPIGRTVLKSQPAM